MVLRKVEARPILFLHEHFKGQRLCEDIEQPGKAGLEDMVAVKSPMVFAGAVNMLSASDAQLFAVATANHKAAAALRTFETTGEECRRARFSAAVRRGRPRQSYLDTLPLRRENDRHLSAGDPNVLAVRTRHFAACFSLHVPLVPVTVPEHARAIEWIL